MTKKTDAPLDVYLESPAGEFVEFHTEKKQLRIRFGTVGRPCIVLHTSYTKPGRAREMYKELRDDWLGRGYVKGAPSAEIVEGSVADELHSSKPESHPLLEVLNSMEGAEDFQEENYRIGLFRNGLRWHDHFDVERIGEFGIHAGVIVDGDVEVEGDGVFSQMTYIFTKNIDARLDVYLESPAGEFVEFHTESGRLRVRFGTVGRPCMVLHATRLDTAAKWQELRDAWIERGYVQRAPSAEIVEGSVADDLFTDEPESHPLFEPFFEMNGADEFSEECSRVALFRNGLRWHDHFDVERIVEFGLYDGVFVEGDVEVDGVFSQLTYNYPEIILVSGDVRAWSFGHKDSSMRVMGDVRVRNIVFGEYNDGSLVIDGDVCGRAFISNDHDMFAEGEHHIWVHYHGNGGEEEEARLAPELFGPEAEANWEDRSWLDEDAMFRFMLEDRDPFRPGMAPELAAEVAQQAE